MSSSGVQQTSNRARGPRVVLKSPRNATIRHPVVLPPPLPPVSAGDRGLFVCPPLLLRFADGDLVQHLGKRLVDGYGLVFVVDVAHHRGELVPLVRGDARLT